MLNTTRFRNHEKIIFAAMLAVSSQYALANANTKAEAVDPQFAKVEALVKANDFKGAHTLLNELAQKGNAQALYNLGYLTQTGQGTAKNEKKRYNCMNSQQAKATRLPTMSSVKIMQAVQWG